MSASATVAAQVKAAPISATRRPRENWLAFISISSIVWSAAKAARVAGATKAPRDVRRYAERTRDRGGFGGGEYARLSTSGSLPGSSIRSVTGWISATPADGGACNVLAMQIAISGQSSQSTGADLSGQHGMSSDMDAARRPWRPWPSMPSDSRSPAPRAGRIRGRRSKRPPAAGKDGSSVSRGWFSHNPAHDGKPGSITKARVSLT